MAHSEIEALLQRVIGLNPASVGAATVRRAVRRRMDACEIGDVADYFDYLAASHRELEALIELVIVPETWFFRFRDSFDALVRFVRDEWRPAHPGEICRLLSIPCSTGEEPYSMAIALLDAGIPAEEFTIDAIDVSHHGLHAAREGLYRPSVFRGEMPVPRERYFGEEEGHFRVAKGVRARVTFHHGNLLAAGVLLGRPRYHAVFCRNLLIYFDRPTQLRAMTALERLLDPRGVLLLGHAETGRFLQGWCPSLRYPSAFVYRRFDDGGPGRAGRRPRRGSPPRPAAAPAPSAPPSALTQRPVLPALAPAPPPAPGLDEICELADAGRIDEGIRACRLHLHEYGPQAEVFYLFGTLHQASGDLEGAEEMLRRALYLDPAHYAALVHLAGISERRGDLDAAVRYRQRARRAAPQGVG